MTHLADATTWIEVWAALESNRIPDPTAIDLVLIPEIVDICATSPSGGVGYLPSEGFTH